jgi:atlastin
MALFGSDDSDQSLKSLDEKRLSYQRSMSTQSDAQRKLDKSASAVSDTHHGDAGNEEDDSDLPRPFQRLDFLVRDWQDFSRNQTLAEKRDDMKQYMKELLSSRKQKDLADTREQISSCFESVQCFLLPHPGHAVTEREYDGSVDAIDNRFLELLTAYLDDLFDAENLFPKKIHGMPVTSRELYTYIKAYAALFREASIFPEAKTLLEATAEANNVNNRDKALTKYKREMDQVAGAKCSYVPIQELESHHQLCLTAAMAVFDAGARMGRHSQILQYRQELANEIEKERQRYVEVNAERDPYKNLEFYLIPGVIALSLLAFRIFQDLMCYDHIGYDIPVYDCK